MDVSLLDESGQLVLLAYTLWDKYTKYKSKLEPLISVCFGSGPTSLPEQSRAFLPRLPRSMKLILVPSCKIWCFLYLISMLINYWDVVGLRFIWVREQDIIMNQLNRIQTKLLPLSLDLLCQMQILLCSCQVRKLCKIAGEKEATSEEDQAL